MLTHLFALLATAAWAEYSGPWRTSLDSLGSCWTEGVRCNELFVEISVKLI